MDIMIKMIYYIFSILLFIIKHILLLKIVNLNFFKNYNYTKRHLYTWMYLNKLI